MKTTNFLLAGILIVGAIQTFLPTTTYCFEMKGVPREPTYGSNPFGFKNTKCATFPFWVELVSEGGIYQFKWFIKEFISVPDERTDG